MPKFSVHVALMGPDYRAVSFAPGDEVPGWAVGQVEGHCLEPAGFEVMAVEPAEDPEPDAEDPASETDSAPDFTAPARRTTRNRK